MKIQINTDASHMKFEDIPSKTMFRVVYTTNKYLDTDCLHYKVHKDLVLLFLEPIIDFNSGDVYKNADCQIVSGEIKLTF